MWNDTAPRLMRSLRRRGVDADTAGDVLQDVAERALRAAPAMQDVEHFRAWSFVVARNLVIDHHRRAARIDLGDPPERVAAEDVEDAVEAADVGARLRLAFRALSATDQAVVLRPEGGAMSGAERVRRHRARRVLAKALGCIAAFGVALERLRRTLGAQNTEALASSLPVVLALFVSASAPPELVTATATAAGIEREAFDDRSTERSDSAHPVEATGRQAHPGSMGAPPPRLPERVAPLPYERIEIPTPTGEPSAIETNEQPGYQPIYCTVDAPVVDDWCTPI